MSNELGTAVQERLINELNTLRASFNELIAALRGAEAELAAAKILLLEMAARLDDEELRELIPDE